MKSLLPILACHAGGRGFDPLRSRHFNKRARFLPRPFIKYPPASMPLIDALSINVLETGRFVIDGLLR